MKLLFIGWNPPEPFGGFWANDDDNLLLNLHWIMQRLGWSSVAEAGAFREEFRTKGFYFVHAVKCFSKAKFPTGTRGTNILKACAAQHLCEELGNLEPQAICVLGQVPLRALKICHPELRTWEKYKKGSEAQVSLKEKKIPVLITYFPNGYGTPGVQRATVLRHLSGWESARTIVSAENQMLA